MLGAEIAALLLFAVIIVLLMAGYPVAFTLGGVSLLFAMAAQLFGALRPELSRSPAEPDLRHDEQ